MAKNDHEFVDNQKDSGWYEIRDWLDRNGCKSDRDNRDGLRGIIDAMRIKKGDNIGWKELDKLLAEKPESFARIEKA